MWAYLAELSSWAVGVEDGAVLVDVACVEQFVELISWLPSGDHVSSYVVEVAQSAGEFDVGSVVESCVAEDADAILFGVSRD